MDPFSVILGLTLFFIVFTPTALVVIAFLFALFPIYNNKKCKTSSQSSNQVSLSKVIDNDYTTIREKYLKLKYRHENLKKVVEITKEEYSRYKVKATIISFIAYLVIGAIMVFSIPFFSVAFLLPYLILCVLIYIIVIWLGGREYKNNENQEREVYQELIIYEKAYKSFTSNQSYKLYFTYDPASIEGESLSSYDRERIALILSIIDSGVSKYLGFSNTVLVDDDFLPINQSADPSFAKLYQSRCILLNKDLEKYDLQLWVNNSKVVLSVPVDYTLSLPQKYEKKVLSYLIVHCGLRIDFA